jgi:tRNA (mo5U34)-methyltransferase
VIEVNRILYPDRVLPTNERNPDFWTRFCVWCDLNGFSEPEFLLPQIIRKTNISPFRFEQRFAGKIPPSGEEVEALGPWDYQIEWSGITSKGIRQNEDWTVHRYRSSLLVDLASEIAGPAKADMSVLDVACHCGILALEFGEVGFGSVKGLDLRDRNIQQAEFLKRTFDCRNVSFEVTNARNLKGHEADVVLCGGLLYHVTFPVELMTDLFNATGKFLVFDSVSQNHPWSGFHIIDERDIRRTLDGDNRIELMPTYRAIIDLLRAVGFAEIYEILGDQAETVPFYNKRNIRSFVATKRGFTIPAQIAGLT